MVRRWAFPLVTAALPLALLVAFEIALRLAGVGYPTSFFLRDGDRYVSNPRYGWRFFPIPLARTPLVLSFPARKPPRAYRVFVLGESAAMGIPEPAFGFSRMLEVMLEARYPGVDVEMINTAMTAINSHVVREIARECARYAPDLFIVYLGNNEVVGPFGPATIFTSGAPALPLIRARMAVQRARTGQLAERVVGRVTTSGAPLAEWRGMEMLTEQQIPADDPRLERTYAHFASNLQDVLAAASDTGAPALVATVATNLRDNPPFGSLHGRDANNADLQYQLGAAALGAGRVAEARERLARARDLDLLRFRADGRINRAIRELAARFSSRGVSLVDAERIFSDASGGAPGDDLFWEHVHLNDAGGYLLARAFFEQAAPLAGRRLGQDDSPRAPIARERVAERLALNDWDRYRMGAAILQMLKQPPFTRQSGHAARLERRRQAVAALRARADIDAAERTYRDAIAQRPDDAFLRIGLATLLRERGEVAEAAAEWQALVQGMPRVAEWRSQLAFALADEARSLTPPDPRKLDEAERLLREVLAEEPDLPAAHVNLANVLERTARADAAIDEYREALRLDPGHQTARFNLASLQAARGALDEAERLYGEAAAIDPRSGEARARLAGVLDKRGRPDEAMAEYRRALDLEPDLAWARNNLGNLLERRGDTAEALRQYRAAADHDPDYTLARLNLADLLMRDGRAAEAAAVFEEVLELARARGDGRLAAAMHEQIGRLRAAAPARR
jgi:tetratricopeptide (TPR) repeat protein